MIEVTSRYFGIATTTTTTTTGRTVSYLRRRFVPPPDRFFVLYEHTVMDGERPDLLAHHYLGDPEQAWRLCDANNVLSPEDLTDRPGTRIRITLPEGVPGTGDA